MTEVTWTNEEDLKLNTSTPLELRVWADALDLESRTVGMSAPAEELRAKADAIRDMADDIEEGLEVYHDPDFEEDGE